MASWLKAAEGLFEVVDRQAKLVVSELAEEQSDSQPSVASNGQGSEAKKTKPKKKALKRQSKDVTSNASDVARKQTGNLAPKAVNVARDKDKDALLIKNDGSESGKPVIQKNIEEVGNLGNDSLVSSIAVTNSPGNDSKENETDHGKVQVPDTEEINVASTLKGDFPIETPREVSEENSSQLLSKETEIANESYTLVVEPEVQRGDSDAPPEIDQVASKSENIDVEKNSEIPLKVVDDKTEASVNQTKQDEQKPDTSQKEEDQLDEAQGLLKTANSTGHSKEARLARVCAGLSSRLQEYKAENAQLEELLVAERELSKSYESHIKQLQNEVSESKGEVTRVETGMVEALAAKNSEIEALVNSMEALKKQAAISEGSLASLQANMESIMRNRELAETRMIQALREELACTERRAEEERSAHNATKMASMEREVELEHRAIESSTALARIQRIADERTTKAADLEQKLALLEIECANLNQELQDMESRVRRGQKKSPEEANQAIQAWQDEVERARQGQRDAEGKLSSLDAEVQKMRVELAAMKRDAEHYSRQEHVELEKRYRELTDLLYYKQTQLETMASEKAAAEFQLEKEMKRLREAQAESERSRVPRRPSSSWEEDTEMKTLEELPLHHRQMDGARVQLQKAAKLLDSGAVRATRFLWRYPKARVLLLFYLVFVHLFLMYLLHRLQEQADELLVREAKFMGLSKP